jgi:hypothetical protein
MFTVLLLSVQVSAWALEGDTVRSFSAKDHELGELVLTVEDHGEPVQQRYVMRLTVKCADRRKKMNSVKPKLEKIDLSVTTEKDETPHDRICKFGAFNFDDDSKILEIKYSKTAMRVGPGECDTDFIRKFDLKKLCSTWND